MLEPGQLNTYDVLISDEVIFTLGALETFLAGPVSGKSAKGAASSAEARRHADHRRRKRRGCELMFDDHRDVLLAPVISEKSYGLLDQNKYTFDVHPDANKTQIKIAVEKVFNVKVTDVNTLNRRASASAPGSDTARARASSARSSPFAMATASRSSADRQRKGLEDTELMGIRKYKPTTPGSSWLECRRLRRDHPDHSGEVAGAPAAQQGRP